MTTTSTVAFTSEPSLLEAPTDPTYNQPGVDVSISELSLQNELERIRDPDQAESIGSVAQILEGALNLEWTLTSDNWHSIVFNNGTTDGFVSGRAPPSRWWIGVDYLDGTAERVIKGAVVTQVTIQYEQGGKITISMNIIYGDESFHTAITPSNIQKSSDTKVWTDLTLDVTDVQSVDCMKLQSLQLQMDTGARFHRGGSRKPCDAVYGAIEHTLTTDATFTAATTDRISLAYGSATATEPQSSIDSVSATIDIGTTTYDISSMKPNSHSWNSVVGPNEDASDNNEYFVDSVTVA